MESLFHPDLVCHLNTEHKEESAIFYDFEVLYNGFCQEIPIMVNTTDTN